MTKPQTKMIQDRNPDATEPNTRADRPQLTCERCGVKTDAGAWLGFVYVGAECLTESDQEYIE